MPEQPDDVTVSVKLTRAQFDHLNLMAGMATGAAFKNGMEKLGYAFLKLANEIHKDNRNWRPYEIPEEYRDGIETEDNAHPQSNRG